MYLYEGVQKKTATSVHLQMAIAWKAKFDDIKRDNIYKI